LHSGRSEFPDSRIDRKISFSPPTLWIGQLWLPINPMSIDEVLNPNSDPADPCSLDAKPVIQLQCLRVDLDGDVGR
jgi:hypothetical protein